MTGWLDDLSSEYASLGIAVDALNCVCEMRYGHIVIAFIDEMIVIEVVKKLIDLGVPSSTILQVSHYESGVSRLLTESGISI